MNVGDGVELLLGEGDFTIFIGCPDNSVNRNTSTSSIFHENNNRAFSCYRSKKSMKPFYLKFHLLRNFNFDHPPAQVHFRTTSSASIHAPSLRVLQTITSPENLHDPPRAVHSWGHFITRKIARTRARVSVSLRRSL